MVVVLIILALLVMAIGGVAGLLFAVAYLAVPVGASIGLFMGMRRVIAGRPPKGPPWMSYKDELWRHIRSIVGKPPKWCTARMELLDDWRRSVVPADLAYALAVAVAAPLIYATLAGEYQDVDGMWRGRMTHGHRMATLVLYTAVPTGVYALLVGVAKLAADLPGAAREARRRDDV